MKAIDSHYQIWPRKNAADSMLRVALARMAQQTDVKTNHILTALILVSIVQSVSYLTTHKQGVGGIARISQILIRELQPHSPINPALAAIRQTVHRGLPNR